MKHPSRAALAAAAALAVLIPLAPSATADPNDPVPSQHDVERAQQQVSGKQRDVKAIEAALAQANDELNRTGARAEMAAERYNAAVWKLGVAKRHLVAARASEKRARQAVADQRQDIALMLTASYRSSVTLDRMQALTTADGPEKLMDRYGAVSGAGASMDHTYDQYAAARTAASKAKARAAAAKRDAKQLTGRARSTRDQAQQVVDRAQAQNDAIAAQQGELMQELASAQGVSRRVAAKRQAGLEARAQAKREAAAQRKAQREAAAQARAAARATAAKKVADAKAAKAAAVKAAKDQAAKAKAAKDARDKAAKDAGLGKAPTSKQPTPRPTQQPTKQPTAQPSKQPTAQPSVRASATPTPRPTRPSTAKPTSSPTSTPTPTADPTPTPTSTSPPPSNGGVSAVIAFAKAQLGERYVWAAAGPDTWDCSGLTMKAWAAAGKSLPHYSAGQYAAIDHISRSELQPGDLVFWGSSPSRIHHVALYIGNGQILHAPRTGRPVAINSIDYWIPPNYFGRV